MVLIVLKVVQNKIHFLGLTISYRSHCHRLEISELISVLFPADLSDSTLSYTETEAASSSNVTPGEFSGGCVSPTVVITDSEEVVPELKQGPQFLRKPSIMLSASEV